MNQNCSNSLRKSLTVTLAASLALLVGARAAADEPSVKPPNRLVLINPDGTNLRELKAFADRNVGSPQWSPDGKWLAYDTWTADFSDTQIEIAGLDGTVKRRLGMGAMPSWSPDGMQIVCHTYESPQTIVVMDVEGNGRETIMRHWGSPRWSPVGNRIISPLPSGGVSVFDVATGEEWVVARDHNAWQGLSISPDGKQFVFGERGGGGASIATFNDDASKVVCKWIVREGESYHSSWSPDGKTVVLHWRRTPAEPEQLYLYAVGADRPPQRLKGQGADCNNRDPSWSPDGKSILFVSTKVR
jgi:Tol biopolymer transport system component